MQQSLELEYKKLENQSAELEKRLISVILKFGYSTQVLKAEDLEQLRKLRDDFNLSLLSIMLLEEKTKDYIIEQGGISTSIGMPYRLQILIGYCLYFYSHKILNLHKKSDFPEVWKTVNVGLVGSYQHLDNLIHPSGKQTFRRNELLYGLTSVAFIQEISNNKLFLSDEDEHTRLIRTHEFFAEFTKNLSDIHLRMQCIIYLFKIEHDDIIRPQLKLAKLEYDHYYNIINSCIKEQKQLHSDNHWYQYFGGYTVCIGHIEAIDNKIVDSTEGAISESTVKKAVIDIKRYLAVYTKVKSLFDTNKIFEVIDKIEETLAEKPKLQLIYSKILQTKEVLQILLEIGHKILLTTLNILNYLIKNADDQNLQLQCLKFKKNCLNNILKIDALTQKLNEEIITPNKEMLATLGDVESTIVKMDKIAEARNTSTKLSSPSKKIIRAHANYRAFFRLIRGNGEADYEEIVAEAATLIAADDFKSACELYQKFLQQNKTINNLQRVMILISLGIVYQTTNLSEKAFETFETAKKITELELATQRHPKKVSELKKQLDLLKDLIGSSDEFNLESNDIPEAAVVDSSSAPTPTILSKEVPLPPFVICIHDSLVRNNRKLFVVGGYIRDAYMNKKAKDIDATVFDPQFREDKRAALTELMTLIKPHYPRCRIHSRTHPVLQILYEENILQISILNCSPSPTPTKNNIIDNKIQLLHEDAAQRDSTENALFYDIAAKEVIDFFNGINHIKEGTLIPIQPTSSSFNKNPTLTFRILRSIIKRSEQQSLVYNPTITTAMQENINQLATLNKDRCFHEIKKTFFEGYALATWNFLNKHNLQDYFFPLPRDEELHYKHMLMIANAFASLDHRLKTGKNFTYSLTLAVILWGDYCESLEEYKKNGTLSEEIVTRLAANVFKNTKLIFKIPDALIFDIQHIWFAYFHQKGIVKFTEPQFRFYHFSLAYVLQRIINRAILHEHPKKIFHDTKIGFFQHSRLEQDVKNIVRGHNMSYSYHNKVVTIALSPSNQTIAVDQSRLLVFLERRFKNIIGKYGVEYSIANSNALTISTDYIDKKRVIDDAMEYIFDLNKVTIESEAEDTTRLTKRTQ